MVRLKLILAVFFAVFGLISSCISSFASTFIPYAGVTDSSSQVNLLYDYYCNLDSFSYDNEFIILRSDQYSYYLFYAEDLSSDTANYISYMGTSSSGYGTVYTIEMGVESDFSYVLNEYSIVGNIPGTAALTEYNDSFYDFVIQIAAYSFLLIFIFSVFRSHFKEMS